MMFHGEPRFTKDLDVFVDRAEANVAAVRKALEEFGFSLSDSNTEQLKEPNQMIALGRPPVRVDILNEIPGVDFGAAWDRRITVEVGDIKATFISLDDLIDAKTSAGRPQDLLDLAGLQAAKHRQRSN